MYVFLVENGTDNSLTLVVDGREWSIVPEGEGSETISDSDVRFWRAVCLAINEFFSRMN